MGKLKTFTRLKFLTYFLLAQFVQGSVTNTFYPVSSSAYDVSTEKGLTELPGGIIKNKEFVLTKAKSPYLIREDLIVERDGKLVIEPGVEIKFGSMVGITVRGVLIASGNKYERIRLTSMLQPVEAEELSTPGARLVDGPSPLVGRLQLRHSDIWRSVCTNSKNWTLTDVEIACRHIGYQGGRFSSWMNREMPLKPRLLYEEPLCSGTEETLFDCHWSTRQLGGGVCDYHPDLAIECEPRHGNTLKAANYWRGIRFEDAPYDTFLTSNNVLYVPMSQSELNYVDITYAGSGRDYNTSSALHIEGVPPVIHNVNIMNSAYNGINVTAPKSSVEIRNVILQGNKGYGVFVNSSYGFVRIVNSNITDNGADGIRYVHNEDRPNEGHGKKEFSDFCTLPTTSSQTYPIQFFAEQSYYSSQEKFCPKTFYTSYGHVLTLSFIQMETDRNNSASIEVYDGLSADSRLLGTFQIRNNTRPQTITSTQNRIYVTFRAEKNTQMFIYMKLTAGIKNSYDLNVTSSQVSDNNGRGIAVDNLRSQLHVHQSSISNNEHAAGIQVTSGSGDINITESRIAFNKGDGINITYTGGNRNISKSIIDSNQGYGVAIWINNTQETEYVFFNQTTVVEYSELYKNLDVGILHGNYCGDSYLNITGNNFTDSLNTAVEIQSCWNRSKQLTKLNVGYNIFLTCHKLCIKLIPALNIDGRFEYNHIRKGKYGGILIKSLPYEEFETLRTNIIMSYNEFYTNNGVFVVNLGLSPYSDVQKLLFTRNFLKDNRIREPFEPEDGMASRLIPRSRVAAPVVVSSANVDIFRNILHNPESNYEVGSHLEDQSQEINCTYNWLGFAEESKIFYRVFDRKDRYNLAKIIYLPYLLHSSNPNAITIIEHPMYVPEFNIPGTNLVGGEVDGMEQLRSGDYIVQRDINVRPGGKLILQPGVKLNFPPSIGMMVAGKLDARGTGPSDITFTLKEEVMPSNDNDTYESETHRYDSETEMVEMESKIPIRLLGGKTSHEGRLQVKINEVWGTVCNYGWTMVNAALVCHQLGLVLNPDDWNLERNEIPNAGTSEKIVLSNVQCEYEDIDITKCKADNTKNFENSCTHDQDVGVRCYETSWAGLRFSSVAERSDLQFIKVERAGLLDYATNYFKPALQIDFAKHVLDSVQVVDNFQDGLGIIYSDIYANNIIRNSDFSNNKGNGISFKQLGMKIQGTNIENNKKSGIRHNPVISRLQQKELAGWFNFHIPESQYNPIFLPKEQTNIQLEYRETRYLLTSRVTGDNISRTYSIKCGHGHVIGIQLLNPIQNMSTETITIYDSPTASPTADVWSVNHNLTVFPVTSSSYGIVMEYKSGTHSLGGTVFVVTTIPAPVQNIRNKIVSGPIPTLTIKNTKIRRNKNGIKTSYYNILNNDIGDHFLRKSNESFRIQNSEISRNSEEAIFVHSPFWDIKEGNISEITLMINNTLITDNGRGIYHFSRDMRSSNNLFHYILQDNTIERNQAGGLELNLPYVWQYNENFTHSIYLHNNTWRDNSNFGMTIDGHFAILNITKNVFTDNKCKEGLISIRGMEKKMRIDNNRIEKNIGKYMVQFKLDSQSEILGNVFALFFMNEIKRNSHSLFLTKGVGSHQIYSNSPTSVIDFEGVQKVRVVRNLFGTNTLDYELVAGIRTAKIDNILDVRENWWGTNNAKEIQNKIFDFDDWNNHAVANFKPFLMDDTFDADMSVSRDSMLPIDLENLGGRINQDLILYRRDTPYMIKSDITVMPDVTLTIYPGVEMEFAPNVGILVLGTLRAQGIRSHFIQMRPMKRLGNIEDNKIHSKRSVMNKRMLESMSMEENIRLCTSRNCSNVNQHDKVNEGFLEYFNSTTLQWIPICDKRFTERNAQVVCRQLGFDPINTFVDYDIRIEYHSNSLTRIWSWPEPLECKGTEEHYDECPIRLNGQLYGHIHRCDWNSKFVFIHCGGRNLPELYDYWGGIRIANPEFEQKMYEHRIHDIHTHGVMQRVESVLEYVNITGAGVLHNEKSPAIQSVMKSPTISFVNISKCASHGINLISPSNTMRILFNNIHDTLGIGINALSLTGEGREAAESSFNPLKDLNIPYNIFSLIDICDTAKEILMEERVILYYKYDNHPVNCVKIFKSAYNLKPFGFRLLQFNLFNSTSSPGVPDRIDLYDGDIYNVSSKLIKSIEIDGNDENTFYRTKEPRLSVKLFANGASSNHGFIAEIVSLPISAIGFSRDVQHNISHSELTYNRGGAVTYSSAGEVNPIITLESNHFSHNCIKLYGNFTTCKAAIDLDIQNTQTVYFRNNLVKENQGGLSIKADSRGTATSLKGYIHNNLFVGNRNLPSLYVEGKQSSPYQEVTIYRNYFAKNEAPFENIIVLKQVVSNFTLNYIHDNKGAHILEVSGFDKVRLPIYQSTSHNGFYSNYAVERDSKGTIVAGTAGQQYVDNIFFNPDNDYEILTVNKTFTIDQWKTKIDAAHNYWGYEDSLAVGGRIRDYTDDRRLLEVIYQPYHSSNVTVLSGKCPPGWDQVGDTCYIYVGAPMTFYEARDFCKSDNASMPYIMGKYLDLYMFLRRQNEWYQYSDRVWVQHIDKINRCTVFSYQTIEIDNCQTKSPFLCEIDPKIKIDPLAWRKDVAAIAVMGVLAGALVLIIAAAACWCCGKNKKRQEQRLQRRNSIRQSLHSLRSVGMSSPGSYGDLTGRRGKPLHMSTRSTDTLTKGNSSEYKKMVSNGSIDSMEKSAFNSSIDDNQSYDIYEAHNPAMGSVGTPMYAATPVFDLAYRNDGFRDNSAFPSRINSNYQSRAESVQETAASEDTPIIHSQHRPYAEFPPSEYYNTDTLPMNSSLGKSNSTLDHNILDDTLPMEETPYGSAMYGVERPRMNFLQELKNKMPAYNNQEYYPTKPTTFSQKTIDLPPKPPTPPSSYNQNGLPYSPDYEEKLENLQYSPEYLEGNEYPPPDRPRSSALLDEEMHAPSPKKYNRSKSETLLETNFDYFDPLENGEMPHPISDASRSKSQPLETAM